jgi:hypothetical protein
MSSSLDEEESPSSCSSSVCPVRLATAVDVVGRVAAAVGAKDSFKSTFAQSSKPFSSSEDKFQWKLMASSYLLDQIHPKFVPFFAPVRSCRICIISFALHHPFGTPAGWFRRKRLAVGRLAGLAAETPKIVSLKRSRRNTRPPPPWHTAHVTPHHTIRLSLRHIPHISHFSLRKKFSLFIIYTMLSSLARNVAFARSAKTVVNRRLPTAFFFSSGTHDDFAPQRKAVEGEDEALKMIKVSDERVYFCILVVVYRYSHTACAVSIHNHRNTWRATQSCCT